MPTTLPLRCGRCKTVLRGAVFNLPGWTPCPKCGAATQSYLFPAFFRPENLALTPSADATEGCYYHPLKSAAAVCAQCGKAICTLCEIEIDGRSLCPGCANLGGRAGKLGPLENESVRHDRIALILGLWPLILCFTLWIVWPVYFLTAGLTFYVVVRHWNAPPRAFLPRSRGLMVWAAICACLQLVLAAGFACGTVWLVSYFWRQ